MCGICGLFDLNRAVDMDLLTEMGGSLRHRGPDDGDFHTDSAIGLGHRRLSIIDLDAGRQPIFNEDGTLAIVFNGEIYNFNELRGELQASGHVFRTRSDTEVIVHLYEEHGYGCLNRLEGMFAFAIWDCRKKELFLARDRFGIKPLVYYYDGGRFVFSSEIKSILRDSRIPREFNYTAFDDYLTFNYIPAPATIYKNIMKLEPGHFLTVKARDGNMCLGKKRYYDVADITCDTGIPLEEAKERLRSALEESVRNHMISDVPIGAFLSGGIDSSIIVGLMSRFLDRPVETFSIGFDGHDLFDETGYARQVSKFNNTEHHEIKLDHNDMLDAIPEVLDNLDEPFSDWSIFPTYLVSRETGRHVKVALSGDGADEVFGGYRKHLGEYLAKYYMKVPKHLRQNAIEPLLNLLPDSHDSLPLEYLRRAKRFVSGISDSQAERHFKWMEIFTADSKKELLSPHHYRNGHDPMDAITELCGRYDGDPLNRILYTDLMFCLPYDMLAKVDSMSMLNSLEVRVPYLDRNLVELAFSLKGNMKLNGLRRKFILVETFKDILPPGLHKRPKQGFDIPIGDWFKKDLRDLFFSVVNEKSAEGNGLFNFNSIKRIYDSHCSNTRDHSKELLNIFVFQWWFNKNQPAL